MQALPSTTKKRAIIFIIQFLLFASAMLSATKPAYNTKKSRQSEQIPQKYTKKQQNSKAKAVIVQHEFS